MDNLEKVKQDKKFVSCKEKYELDYIKKEMKTKYPELTDAEIDEALENCCQEVPPPRPRDKYMECLEGKLNIGLIDREAKSDRVIRNRMYWSLGIGLVPFPLFDLAALLALQVKMVYDISKVYGVPFSENRSKSIILSLFGNFNTFTLAAIAGRSFIKLVPGIGGLLGVASFSVFAGATTYAIGKVFVKHFEMGGTLLDFDTKKMKTFFQEKCEEGMEKAKQVQEGQKQKA